MDPGGRIKAVCGKPGVSRGTGVKLSLTNLLSRALQQRRAQKKLAASTTILPSASFTQSRNPSLYLPYTILPPRSGDSSEFAVSIMAEAVEQLKSTINALEKRVHELEARLQGKASPSSSSTTDGMRMILIGPPGAGMSPYTEPLAFPLVLTVA